MKEEHHSAAAREMAQKPVKDKGERRNHFDGSTPWPTAKRPKTDYKSLTNSGDPPPHGKTSPTALSFEQVVSGRKNATNDIRRKAEQLGQIQDAILKQIMQKGDGYVKPMFLGSSFKAK